MKIQYSVSGYLYVSITIAYAKTYPCGGSDPSIAEVLTIILEQEAYKVEWFTNDSFINGLAHNMPALILLDMWLLGMNGKDICLLIKRNDALKQIPVVIMSANRDIKLHAEEAEADGYLAKPFDMNVLLLLVKKFMD